MSTLLEILGDLKQQAKRTTALLEAHEARLELLEQWRREEQQWRRDQEVWKQETTDNLKRTAALLLEISGIVQNLHTRVSKLESDKAPD